MDMERFTVRVMLVASAFMAIVVGVVAINGSSERERSTPALYLYRAAVSHEQQNSYEQQNQKLVQVVRDQSEIMRLASQFDTPIELASSIYWIARRHGIPPDTAFRLIEVESNFRPDALSWAGAMGLAQVKPTTARAVCSMDREQLREVANNLHCGFLYLRKLFRRYDNWRDAIESYNAGPTRHDRAPRTGEYDGGSYADKVLR